MTLALFQRFPELEARLPWQPLCELPTPVEGLLLPGVGELSVKRDDKTAADYGGNKVRKLEFLLADAQRRGASKVLTFGFAGSNFAAATAFYARRQGMGCVSMLLPQEPEPYVRDNLALQLVSGAEPHLQGSVPMLTIATISQLLLRRLRTGRWPYRIPAGGSSPLGVLGFVNAALELNEQLARQGEVFPDRLYLAMGSMGSVAGLAVGAALLGVETRIVAVRVVEARFAGRAALRKLADGVLRLLKEQGLSVPEGQAVMQRVELREEFFGEAYGVPTAATCEAMEMAGSAGLPIDSAYTGKALACLIHDLRSGKAGGSPLFWLTCNGRPLGELVGSHRPENIPPALERYFRD